MEGRLNVSGPVHYDIEVLDTSVRPNLIVAALGQTLSATVWNNGTLPHTFAIGPPYNTGSISISPSNTAPFVIVLNRTVPSTWYGGDATERAAGIVGELRVVAAGAPPPPPPPPAGVPFIPPTVRLPGPGSIPAIAVNFPLAG